MRGACRGTPIARRRGMKPLFTAPPAPAERPRQGQPRDLPPLVPSPSPPGQDHEEPEQRHEDDIPSED